MLTSKRKVEAVESRVTVKEQCHSQNQSGDRSLGLSDFCSLQRNSVSLAATKLTISKAPARLAVASLLAVACMHGRLFGIASGLNRNAVARVRSHAGRASP